MTALADAAAATAAVLSFHCIICFDEFNLSDRPPVVLPCGHTYVCESCAKRLTKCMECRTPLFLTPPQGPEPPAAGTRQAPTRYGRYQTPSSPTRAPPKVAPIPLPLPKNVVLLAMIEAAERQAISVRRQEDEVSDDDEKNRIVSGVETLSGSCGTYAVADREGLAVLAVDPRRRMKKVAAVSSKEPFAVERGQMVQVVDFSDGVAVLARDMGFIVAVENQLVKVGGPLETACQLQGTLDMIAYRKKALERNMRELEGQSEELEKRIEAELMKEPSHPIITPPPLLNRREPDSTLSTPPRATDSTFPVQSPPEIRVTPSYDVDGVELVEEAREDPLSPHTIDNSDLSLYVDENTHRPLSDEMVPDSIELGCSALFGAQFTEADSLMGWSFESGAGSPGRDRTSPGSIRDAGTSRQQGRSSTSPASTSFETVNFRTGMSGHRGLSRAQRQTDPRTSTSTRQVRMMGDHRGVAKMRGPGKKLGPRNANS